MRIVSPLLAEDYSLWTLPALAFFRHFTPILYTGDITNQEEVFEFLFQNKYTADEDIDLEEVDEEHQQRSTLVSLIPVFSCIFITFGYACGLGPVPFILFGELFPSKCGYIEWYC